MGSNGTHKNKTYLSKEKNSKVHIHIGKCIYGYGAMSNKVRKCTKCTRMRAFSRIFAHCSATVTQIQFCFFALIPCYQGASVNYHKQWFFSSLIFDFKGDADFFKCTFQCEYALLNFILLLNKSYFWAYHWDPFDINWYLIFWYFQTALVTSMTSMSSRRKNKMMTIIL